MSLWFAGDTYVEQILIESADGNEVSQGCVKVHAETGKRAGIDVVLAEETTVDALFIVLTGKRGERKER